MEKQTALIPHAYALFLHQPELKCELVSRIFSQVYGVRQGAVSIAILFAVYINQLVSLLKSSRFDSNVQSSSLLTIPKPYALFVLQKRSSESGSNNAKW